MGWFWESKSESQSTANLDPQLREFLDQSTTAINKPVSPQNAPPSSDPDTYRTQLGWDKTPGLNLDKQTTPTPSSSPDPHAVPTESLYQDGRYAHLWQNYRPQSDIESRSRSEQEKMTDVIAAFNERRAAVGRAAVENCVMEQMAQRDCWENGSWADRLTMCRGPSKSFLRCYTMQARFLKALGYLSEMRSDEEQERVQMHADKLYHDMLEREARLKEAREKGEAMENLPPLMNVDELERALGDDSAWARSRKRAMELGIGGKLSDFPATKQKAIKDKVEKLDEVQKEVELQLLAAENRAHLELQDSLAERLKAESKARADRLERGKATMGDRLKQMSGWN